MTYLISVFSVYTKLETLSYFAYMNLSPEVQQAYKELILYCGGVEDLLQKSEISQYELVLHKDDNWKIVG